MLDYKREEFRKSNVDPKKLYYTFNSISEIYTPNSGWILKNPIIESTNEDGTIDICIPIEKRSIEDSIDIYQELFQMNDVDPKDLDYNSRNIKSNFPAEDGWNIGDPVVLSTNEDGTVNFYMLMEKNMKEKAKGHTH